MKNGTQVVSVDSTATCGATTTGSATAIGWTVSGSTTLDLGISVIVGANSTFTNLDSSTLRIGSPGGIAASSATGNIQTGTRLYNTNANYFYTGTNAQVTGTGLPTTTGNIQILNTNGVVTLTQSATVNTPGTFTVATGAFLQGSSDNINGTGNFTLQDGGTLGIDSSGGLTASSTTSGLVRVSGTRTTSASGIFIYNGVVAQNIGGGLPSTASSVTISNTTAAVSLSSGSRTVTNLTVIAGATLDFASTTSASQTLTTVNPPVLNGTNIMEVNKTAPNTFTGSKLTQLTGTLNYSGTLIVTNLGSAIQTGDSIPVFVSTGGFSGGFSSVTAPAAPAGLTRNISQLTGGTGGNITYTCDGTLVANSAANTSICSGDSYSLNGSGSGGSGSFTTFGWTATPAGFTSTSANPSVSPTVTTTYHLTVTDSVGCTATKDVVVTVNPLPTVAISATSTNLCTGNSTLLTASGATTYGWSPSTGLSATTGASVTATPTVTTSYTATGTNANGCVNTASVTITVNALPTTSGITGTNSVQQLTSATYSVVNTAGSTYGWTVPSGGSFTGGTGNSINVTFGSTSGNVTVVETNAAGCTGTPQTLAVTVITCTAPSIVGGIDASATNVCVGSPIIFTLTNATGTATLTYQWQTNNMAVLGATNASYTNISVTLAAAANYACVVANGCGSITSAVVTLTVNAAPTITTSSLPNGIYGSAYSQSITASGGSTPYTYGASSLPPGLGINTSSGLISGTPTLACTSNVLVTVTSSSGCVANTNYSLTVNARGITVTADGKTKVYGASDPALTYSHTPSLVSGDSFSGALSRTTGESVGFTTSSEAICLGS